MSPLRALPLALIAFTLPSCAVLHHAQLGDIDARHTRDSHPIDIKVSEMGFNMDEIRDLNETFNKSAKGQKAIDDIITIISLFQQGPSTGNPVFTDAYAKNIIHSLFKECPSGRITGLTMMRETRKYPVISGEIIRVTGDCLDGAPSHPKSNG